MTDNLTKEEILDYQEQATLFARLINTWDGSNSRRVLASLEQLQRRGRFS
jgi:hypothetical protein